MSWNQICILTYIVGNTYHWLVIAPFSVQLLQLFELRWWSFGDILVNPAFFAAFDWYILVIQETLTHETHFFLPTNCWHISHISRKLMKQSFSLTIQPKSSDFSLFWCILCMSSLIFPVQAKISTIQPKFLDYLSVSYHYEEIKISLVIYLIYWL